MNKERLAAFMDAVGAVFMSKLTRKDKIEIYERKNCKNKCIKTA